MSATAGTLGKVRRFVASRFPDLSAESLVPLGDGIDHAAYLLAGRFVIRIAADPDAARVEREARLLEMVAAISPLPTPVPVLVAGVEGCLVYELLPGTALLDLPTKVRTVRAPSIGATLGRLLAALNRVPPAAVTELVEFDDAPPETWLADAAHSYERCAREIPPAHRGAVAAFLASPLPPPATALSFTHSDLGIEHVIVEPSTGSVSGVIDWTDAAIADPARDLGLILRDLGPAAFEEALAVYGRPREDPAALRRRVRFHARCGLLEDLAYGLQTGKKRYAEKSLLALPVLFPANSST